MGQAYLGDSRFPPAQKVQCAAEPVQRLSCSVSVEQIDRRYNLTALDEARNDNSRRI